MPVRYQKRSDNTVGVLPQDTVVTFNYDILGLKADAWVFVADTDYEVTRIVCIPTVAGTDGSAVTADVMKASGTTAVASGTTVLSAADSFNLKGTAHTLQTGTLTATTANKRLTTSDRLGINFTGTLTSAEGLIQIHLKRVKSIVSNY